MTEPARDSPAAGDSPRPTSSRRLAAAVAGAALVMAVGWLALGGAFAAGGRGDRNEPALRGTDGRTDGPPGSAPVASAAEPLRTGAGYEFTSALPLSEMKARLDRLGPWTWNARESHWYGDYLATRAVPVDGALLRILPRAAGGWGLDVRFTSTSDGARGEWAWIEETVRTKLLPALDAKDVTRVRAID